MGSLGFRAFRTGILVLLLAAVPPPPGARAVTSELVVADPRSGVALFGFDPVSYFLEQRAAIGSRTTGLTFGGFTWHFRSEGNRAAFAERPDVYVPRFGGYDPVALARGVPVAGHPSLFVVHAGQLFLFHLPESRAAFLADPEAALKAARSAWPNVRRTLVP